MLEPQLLAATPKAKAYARVPSSVALPNHPSSASPVILSPLSVAVNSIVIFSRSRQRIAQIIVLLHIEGVALVGTVQREQRDGASVFG